MRIALAKAEDPDAAFVEFANQHGFEIFDEDLRIESISGVLGSRPSMDVMTSPRGCPAAGLA